MVLAALAAENLEYDLTNVGTYETTKLDWNAIKSLATRAAKETPLTPGPAVGYVKRSTNEFIDVCGPHWLLDNRYEWWEENREHIVEESRTEVLYALMPGGDLVKITISEEFQGHREGHWRNLGDNHFVHPMTEEDAESFDFAVGYHESGHKDTPQGHIWGNCDRPFSRGPLLQSSKGAGLSQLLENIRTGRAKQPEGLVIPDNSSQKTAETRTQLLPSPTKFHYPPDARAKVIAELQSTREKAAAEAVATETARAARQRSAGDSRAIGWAVGLAITVLVPFLIGHLLLTKTFILKPNLGVYDGQARGIVDHFFATYLAGLVPIALALGVFLVARQPWRGRTVAVAVGVISLVGSLVVLLPMTMSKWNAAEQKTVAKLRETAYPFSDSYYTCASWKVHAENGLHDPELWQVYLAQVKGTTGSGCNRVWVYRGWQPVSSFDLPGGDVFTGEAIVNHFDWPQPVHEQGTGDIWSQSSATGGRVAMNPRGTNVDLPTANGQVVDFTLDVAGTDGFKLQ